MLAGLRKGGIKASRTMPTLHQEPIRGVSQMAGGPAKTCGAPLGRKETLNFKEEEGTRKVIRRFFILMSIAAAVLTSAGAANAGGVIFTGSSDATPALGNATHVVTNTASGIQISGGTPAGGILGSTSEFGPLSITAELGSSDFVLGMELDPTSAPLPPTPDGGLSVTSFGLFLTFDGLSDFVVIGWANPADGSGNAPFINHVGGGLVSIGPDATGSAARLTLTRVGDHITLTDSRYVGELGSSDLATGAAISEIAFYAVTDAGPIPAGGGKILRIIINSPAITTNINAFSAPTPTPIPTPVPTPLPPIQVTPQTGQWTEVPLHGGSAFNGIVVDPADADHVFAIFGGGGNRYVVESTNGGTQWTEKTPRYAGQTSLTDPWFLDFIKYVDGPTTDTILAGKFRSDDNGATFQEITTLPDPDLWVCEVDPNNSQVLYASRGSDLTTSRTLLFKSTDDGGSWTELAGLALENARASLVVVDPSDSNTILVGVTCSQTSLADVAGVYRSTDGGANFTRVLGSANALQIDSLAAHPAAPGVFFASAGGIYRSTDNGASWSQVYFSGSHCVIPHPTDPSIVYAYTNASNALEVSAAGFFTYVMKSTNGGVTFEKASFGPVAFPHFGMSGAIHPDGGGDVLYVGGANMGIYRSANGGVSWEERNGGIRDNAVRFITEAAGDPTRLLVSNDRGMAELRLENGEMTLRKSGILNLPTEQIVFDHTAVDRGIGQFAYNYLVRTSDGGETWENPRGFGSFVGQSPSYWNIRTVYASHVTSGRFLVGVRANLSDGGIFKTSDFGATYDPTPTLNLPANIIESGFITGVGEVLYAGVFGDGGPVGGVYRSDDDGETWTPVGLSNLYIKELAVDPGDGNRAYAVAHLSGPPYDVGVYRTTDGGQNWTDIKPLMDLTGYDGFVNEIELDPDNGLSILGAAPTHILSSSDGGDTWELFEAGLSNVYGLYIAPGAGARPAGRIRLGLPSSPTDRLFAGRNGSLYTRYQPTVILGAHRSWRMYP